MPPNPARVLGCLGLLLTPALAWSYSVGAPGYSGVTGASCTTCHAVGAPVPTVLLEGPTSLAAGETGSYTFTVSGGPGVRAGMTVLANLEGTTLTPGPGLRVMASGRELTHAGPVEAMDGKVVFTFTLVAPPEGGTLTLHAAGNSVNYNRNNSGDASATTSLAIEVDGPRETESGSGGGCAAAGTAALVPWALLATLRLWKRRSR